MPTLSRFLLPGVAGLLGLTGLAGGLYSLVSPFQVLEGFGLSPTANTNHSEHFETALIHAYGIRNIGTGLSLLSLIAFWAREDAGPRKDAIREYMGLSLTLGTVVAMGDAWLIRTYAKSPSCDINARNIAKSSASGHAGAAVIIFAVGVGLLLT